MQFVDKSINSLDLTKPDDFAICIIEKMCGKKYLKSDRYNYLIFEILKNMKLGKQKLKEYLQTLTKSDKEIYYRINKEIDFNDQYFQKSIKEKNINHIIESLYDNNPFDNQVITLNNRDFDIFSEFVQKLEKVKQIDIHIFNEILLLLNQHKVSEGFFRFFFTNSDKDNVTINSLKTSVTNFRGLGILFFGNSRFAYKKLCMESYDIIAQLMKKYDKNNFDRAIDRTISLDIKQIPSDKTWFNGYISKKLYDLERKVLMKEFEKKKSQLEFSQLNKLKQKYLEIGNEIENIEKNAFYNTDIYLSYSNLDVYIATSMRNKWDFENVSEFINDLFYQKDLASLNLRYFDPTQSHCPNRIDKGLIEGLMLKRSKCTIYLVQEDDTLGKDSELASTLAQGKPVIAYIPEIDIKKHKEKIKKYPLSYIKNRFYSLGATNIFDNEEVSKILSEITKKFKEEIFKFICEIDKYRKIQPFSLWIEKEEEFKENNEKIFDEICFMIATAEYYHYNKREKTLREDHPLAIQTHLESGVANGLLVVRDIAKCSKLLQSIFKNDLGFTIGHSYKDNFGFKYLEENISKCIYRVETEYNKLTNSYWNLYFE